MITGLKSAGKEVEALREMLPKTPSAKDIYLAESMSRFTPREICRMGSILTRMDMDVVPTEEEVAFMTTMDARPIVPVPPPIPGVLRCHICGAQPTLAADNNICDNCWREMGGYADLSKLPRDGYGNFLA
jgi:ribosomal protein S14